MRYLGSKQRFMKSLLPVIMDGVGIGSTFFDCFAGGMNVVCKIPLTKKVAFDTNRYVISLWEHIQKKGLENLDLPRDSYELTKELYEDIRKSYINNDRKYDDYLIGYVATSCSYGSAWFNGYAKYNERKKEDHIKEAYNGLRKQVDGFKYLDSTEFICASYEDIHFCDNSVIFCDPPYALTKQYESDFDSGRFWDWARSTSKEWFCKKLMVTEYTAPDDFECVWEKNKSDGLGTTKMGVKQTVKTEKMFMLKK